MAITIGGEFRVGRSPAEVFDFLTDPNRFAPVLPDFEGLTVKDASHFTVKARVGVSHIRGTATVELQLAESEKPKRALYTGKGSLAGGAVNLKAGFDLFPDGGGTRVAWKGEAHVFGPLISIAGGLLEPLAKKNVQKLIDGLQAAMS